MDKKEDDGIAVTKLGLSLTTLIFVSNWLCSGSPDLIDAVIYWISGGYYKVR